MGAKKTERGKNRTDKKRKINFPGGRGGEWGGGEPGFTPIKQSDPNSEKGLKSPSEFTRAKKKDPKVLCRLEWIEREFVVKQQTANRGTKRLKLTR